LNFEQLISMLYREPYLAFYGEVVDVGGLPLLILLAGRDSPEIYGLRRQRLLKSLALSIPLTIAILVAKIAYGDIFFESFSLSFPYNV